MAVNLNKETDAKDQPETQAPLQPDYNRFSRKTGNGRFLIRPHGDFGSVYEVGVDAKDKFLRYRRMAGLPYIGIFLMWIFQTLDVMPMLYLLVIWGGVDIYIRHFCTKGGRKVEKSLWIKPTPIEVGPLFPKWSFVIFIPMLLFIEYFLLRAFYMISLRWSVLNNNEQWALFMLALASALGFYLLWRSYKSLIWQPKNRRR